MPYSLEDNTSLPYIYYFHKGKTVPSRVGSLDFDTYLLSINYNAQKIGKIPAQYAYRPDLLANLWYGSPYFWWMTMVVNGIYDPFESLYPGASILVPKE